MDNKIIGKKLFIFDVDGTILDTAKGLIASTRFMINELGLNIPDGVALESFVGPRIQDSLARVFGMQGEELNSAAKIFRDHYKEGDVLVANPYPGIFELLDFLKAQNIHMAVATNKRQDFVDLLIEKYNFSPYFPVVFGTDMEGKLKKSDLIIKCLEAVPDCKKDDAVMIGDSDYDAEAAAAVGIDFIAVTYGYGFKEKEEIDRYPNILVIQNISDLLPAK